MDADRTTLVVLWMLHFVAVVAGIIHFNVLLSRVRADLNAHFNRMDEHFDRLLGRFDSLLQRFDDFARR